VSDRRSRGAWWRRGGLAARVALRLLALAAALSHNQSIGQPGRHLAPYNH